jgi:oxygen-dependent protoporphyrinogen oxidase
MANNPIIVGAGISGLSAAYYLTKGGSKATMLESRPRMGGVIQTDKVQGCILEAGPDSFLSAKPAALELIRELGMSDQVIGSNDHVRVTFVRRNGQLIPLPDGLMMMVPTKIMPLVTTPLLGWWTKARMGMELLRRPRRKSEDQSVSDFITDHYGRETVDYLAEPLLSGVYGGDPAALSIDSVLPRFADLARRYGSLTRGVLAERAKAASQRANATPPPLFTTLKGGLGQLVDAVGVAIRGKAQMWQTRVEKVERKGSEFRVKMNQDWVNTNSLVVACEAHSAAKILAGVDGRLAELLGTVGYSSAMTVALGFDAADFITPPVGFGFLVPRKERRRVMACTWVGTKFSYRVPEGKIVARCSLGGTSDPTVLDESDESIVAAVTSELQEIAGITAVPRFSRVARWPQSMAQYTVGHAKRLDEIQARVAAIPGLYLAGNAYTGIGIPDCIRMGKAAAEAVLKAPSR